MGHRQDRAGDSSLCPKQGLTCPDPTRFPSGTPGAAGVTVPCVTPHRDSVANSRTLLLTAALVSPGNGAPAPRMGLLDLKDTSKNCF